MQNKLLKYTLNDFDLSYTIGIGSYGRIKLCRQKNRNRYFAMKILKKSEIVRCKQVDHVMNEYTILKQIQHPFIIKLQTFLQDSRYIYFVLELVQGGDMFNYLRSVEKFETYLASFYASQIVLIFQYLHSKHIIYRDLKPENILIAKDGYIKLADFGFAKVVEMRTFTLCGTPEYLAPEILLNQGHGKPADWWTLGILIYQMIAGIDPFSDEDPMNIYQNILKGKLRFPKNFDKEARSLVRHLLVSDLSRRYGNLKNGASDIKQHKFFHKTDFKLIYQKKATAYYKPSIVKEQDISNFNIYPDSLSLPSKLQEHLDPFLSW